MIISIPTDIFGFTPLFAHPLLKIEERMRRKTIIDPKTGCWLFTKSLKDDGYAQIWDGEKLQQVHRIAAVIYLGYDLLDKEHQINHKDICPYRNCWWYEHLYIGTQQENVHDAITKGIHMSVIRSEVTHCPKEHPYDNENTIIDKNGNRSCRTCQIEHKRKYRELHKGL